MKTNVNFYYRYKNQKSGKKANPSVFFLRLLPFVALFIAFAALYIPQHLEVMELQAEYDSYLDYLSDPVNTAAYDDYRYYSAEALRMAQNSEADEYALAAIKSYPRANSAVLDTLRATGEKYSVGITVSSYSASSGVLSFSAVAGEAEMVNGFIRELDATGLFAKVDYTGYASSGAASYSPGARAQNYAVNLRCVLDEFAGKEAASDEADDEDNQA